MTEEATGGEAAVESTEETTSEESPEATETPAEEAEATETEGPKDLDTDDDQTAEAAADESEGEEDEEAGEEETEEIEFDFGGNKLRVPKDSIPEELAVEIDKFTKGTWADYTRKSQDAVERSKALEAREGAVEKLGTMSGEILDTYSRGLQLQSELTELGKTDLNTMWQSDPDQARRISDQISNKQAEFNSVVSRVSEQEQSLANVQQEETARRIAEGKILVEKQSKGFEAQAAEVVKYVTENYAVSLEEANQWPLNPVSAVMARKAMLYDRMQAKAKKPSPAPSQAKPVAPMKAKGASKGSSDPDKMSMSQLAKHLEVA